MSFPELVSQRLAEIEQDTSIQDVTECLKALRTLSFDEFALVLLHMPSPAFPRVSKLLPHMASDEVQRNWTGSSGVELLRQSTTFVRNINYNFHHYMGRSLAGQRILDYGCGYGRLLRLMYYFSNPTDIIGCDPWDRSIELCKQARLPNRFDVTDYLPKSLPYEAGAFDMIYAFSVFTHTSQRATQAALSALRQTIKPDGLLVVTIRPREYWPYFAQNREVDIAPLLKNHDDHGFAFLPHNRLPVDGDITYGDTSMTMNILTELCPQWTIAGYDRSISDTLQLLVFLRPV